ncbi:BAG family molecular chaperone regulator 1 [Octopus vulgaris]|uniref:BAG family molecular chaperone regulator 1 n=1 Tax=Octopus vulgaris TaxID=6645 RepID=A0AA36BNP9_OCTVU|nr:BAG family molecular chaperone regulator 1 [Octopus vulgaris]
MFNFFSLLNMSTGVVENVLKLVCSHGSKKYNVTLKCPEDSTELNCGHLFSAVENVTGVPENRQRLIFKGKSLTDAAQNLSEMGMKEGAIVMLMTKAIPCKDGETLTKEEEVLLTIDSEVEAKGRYLQEFTQNVMDFCQAEDQKAREKMKIKVKAVEEEFMKLLEKLDGTVLEATDYRTKRKELVMKVQGLLQRCDCLTEMLNICPATV